MNYHGVSLGGGDKADCCRVFGFVNLDRQLDQLPSRSTGRRKAQADISRSQTHCGSRLRKEWALESDHDDSMTLNNSAVCSLIVLF